MRKRNTTIAIPVGVSLCGAPAELGTSPQQPLWRVGDTCRSPTQRSTATSQLPFLRPEGPAWLIAGPQTPVSFPCAPASVSAWLPRALSRREFHNSSCLCVEDSSEKKRLTQHWKVFQWCRLSKREQEEKRGWRTRESAGLGRWAGWAGTVMASVAQARHLTAEFGSRTMSLAFSKGICQLALTKCLTCSRHPAPSLRYMTHLGFRTMPCGQPSGSSPGLHQEIVPVVSSQLIPNWLMACTYWPD